MRVAGAVSVRRVVVLGLLSIPVAAEMILGEVLFVGHIVFLVETLGFAWALIVFAAVWAALGLVVLAVIDFLWPRMGPSLNQLLSRLMKRAAEIQDRIPMKRLLAVLGVCGLLAAAVVAIILMGRDIREWAVDHRGDVGMFLIAAVVVSAILIAIARLGRGLEIWVRSIADTAGPVMRSLGALLSMMVLGPVLSWLLFRLLGYSRRSVYTLTLVSAPVFGGVWVPLYGLGVWGLVEGLI